MQENRDWVWMERQLAEVRSLQQRIRAVILDDSLEGLELMMDEKRSRLASLAGISAQHPSAAMLADALLEIAALEAQLEQLVQDRLMLMRNELRKTSETGRALRGYVSVLGRSPEGQTRDLQL